MAIPLLAGIPVVGKIIDGIFNIIDKVVPDKNAAEKMKNEIQMLALTQAHEEIKGQLEINKQEAAHSSIFVAGWRPSIGWVCSMALFYKYIGNPIFEWVIALKGLTVKAPVLEAGELFTLVLGMLGMGTLRTFEKMKGLNSK